MSMTPVFLLPSSYPQIGQRIRLRRPAPLASDPSDLRGETGMTGMVLAVIPTPGQESISVRKNNL